MKKKTDRGWVVKIIAMSVLISAAFTFVSAELLRGSGYIAAFIVLFVFIVIGVVFDIIGVAVTSADETPFHSMASHNERGAAEAIRLIRRAERVSSVCNDVVGDIAGIVSGATSAIIVSNLVRDLSFGTVITQIGVSGLVAGLTIGGKALGKAVAMNNNTYIVHACGKTAAFFKKIFNKK